MVPLQRVSRQRHGRIKHVHAVVAEIELVAEDEGRDAEEAGIGRLRGCWRRTTPSTGVDETQIWPYFYSMATMTIKSTYSLDVDTVKQLENLAKHWNTSKSGALRRAIRSAATGVHSGHNEALDALDRLQDMLALDHDSARAWADEILQEREASADRGKSRTLG